MGSCLEHGKDLVLFCTETRCKTLICTVCMTKRHLGHKVVDIDVDRKEELLSSLTSAIENLSSRKRLIETIHAEVGRKNEGCLNNLSEEKKSTLKMVKDRYDSLIAVAANQKDKSSARIKSEMTSLEESLNLLNNIKQYLDEETLSPRDVRNCEETIEKITEHIDHILTTPPGKEYIVYIENKRNDRLVVELCGKLMQRNHNKEGADKQPEKLGSIFATGVKNSGGLFVEPGVQSNLGIETTFLQSSTQPFTQSGLNFGLGTTDQQPSTQAVKPAEKSGFGFGLRTTVQQLSTQPDKPAEKSGFGFGLGASVLQPSTQAVKPAEKSGFGFGFGTTVQQPSTQAVKPITQSGLALGTSVQQPSTQAVKPAEKSGLGFGFGATVQQPSTQAVKPAEKSGLGFGFGTTVQQPSTQAVKPITQSGLALGTTVQQPSTQAVEPAEKSGLGFGFGTTVQQPSTQAVKPITQSGLALGTSVQQPSTQAVKPAEKSGLGFGFGTTVQQPSTQAVKPAEKSGLAFGFGTTVQQPSTQAVKPVEKTLNAMTKINSRNSEESQEKETVPRFQCKYL